MADRPQDQPEPGGEDPDRPEGEMPATYDPSAVKATRARMQTTGGGAKDMARQRDPTGATTTAEMRERSGTGAWQEAERKDRGLEE